MRELKERTPEFSAAYQLCVARHSRADGVRPTTAPCAQCAAYIVAGVDAAPAQTGEPVAWGVTQTITGDDGNCLEACLATIFALPLEDVPRFRDESWWEQILAFLRERGLSCRSTMQPPQGLSVAVGESPRRSVKHAVVAINGFLAFDPHPDRTFFRPASDVSFLEFVPLPAPTEEGTPHDWEKVIRDTETYKQRLARDEYIANFGDQAKGIDRVVLPLGDPDAIKRLLRDLVAWGFGMGQAEPESAEALSWHERATVATEKLNAHIAALRAPAPVPEVREEDVAELANWVGNQVESCEAEIARTDSNKYTPEDEDDAEGVPELEISLAAPSTEN